jgi:hypothetical protein
MRFWTAHEPRYAASAAERAEGIVFVKDGFSWPGLFISLPWLLYHRLWLGTLIYVVISLAIGAAGAFLPLNDGAGTLLGLIASLYVGFEGNDLRRRKLAKQGFTQVQGLSAKSLLEAETAFFAERPAAVPFRTRPAPRATDAVAARPADPDVLGLFPEPGARP